MMITYLGNNHDGDCCNYNDMVAVMILMTINDDDFYQWIHCLKFIKLSFRDSDLVVHTLSKNSFYFNFMSGLFKSSIVLYLMDYFTPWDHRGISWEPPFIQYIRHQTEPNTSFHISPPLFSFLFCFILIHLSFCLCSHSLFFCPYSSSLSSLCFFTVSFI